MIEGNNNQLSSKLSAIEELEVLENTYEAEKEDFNFMYYCIIGLFCALVLVTINQFRVNSKLDSAITKLNDIKIEQANLAISIEDAKEVVDQSNSISSEPIIESDDESKYIEESPKSIVATKPVIARLYTGYEQVTKPELESMHAYTMTTSDAYQPVENLTRSELKSILASLNKEELGKIDYLMSGIENKKIESLKEKDIKRILTFIGKAKSYNPKAYSPLKVSTINYPDPSMLDSDPVGYVTNHLAQTQEMYGGITASLAQVEQYLISKTR